MKKLLITGFFLLFYVSMQAQETGHYLYLNTRGGFHNLSYDLQNGNEKGSIGYTLNAGYGYFFNKHWGIQTGIGLQSFMPTATLNYMTTTPSTDTDGDTYEYRTNYNNWKEKQTLLFFEIPVGLQYRQSWSKRLSFLASAGLKISIPVKTTYQSSGGEIVTTGYYSQWNVILSDLPQHGFNTVSGQHKGDVSLKPSYSGFVDLGALIRLSPKLELYGGGYANYGLNNILKSGNKPVYQKDGVYNGVLASDQTPDAKLISLGMKIGIQWYFGHKNKTTEVLRDDELPVAEKAEVSPKNKEVNNTPKTAPFEQPIHVETTTAVITQMGEAYKNAKVILASTVINFKFNTNQTSNMKDAGIQALSDILKSNPEMSLRIIGHTCNLGTRKVNLKVGMKRAIAVKQIFLGNGVSDAQLLVETRSFDDPLVPNTSIVNRIQNRRVTLIIKNDPDGYKN